MVAAHAWPAESNGAELEDFGLSRADVWSPRNVIPMLASLETAFQNMRFALQYAPASDTFVVHVFDPALRGDTAHSNAASVHSLHGKEVALRGPAPGARPFRRVVMWHFALAVDEAFAKQWLSEEQQDALAPQEAAVNVDSWLHDRSPGADMPARWPGACAAYEAALRNNKVSLPSSDS